MNLSAFKEKDKNPPILIIDKVGVIGEAIGYHFSKDYLVVLVSERLFSTEDSNIVHVPFKKKIPQVPDNQYAKIFIVDDGSSVTRESAFSFIDKALENNAPLYFIGSIRNIDVEHADEITKSYKYAKVLLFGDLFDNALVFEKSSSINQFILSVRDDQRIEVSGNGLSLNFPITYKDTVKLIVKATELELDQKIILLFSGSPITDIALANEFKKIKPLTKIEFVKGKKNKKIYIPGGAMHALDKYDLQDRIKDLDLGRIEKRQIKESTTIKGRTLPSSIYFLLTVLFIILLPLFTTYPFIFIGNLLLERGANSLNLGNPQSTLSYSKPSLFVFELSDKTFHVLDWELKFLKLDRFANGIEGKVSSGKYLAQAEEEISNGLLGFKKIYEKGTNSPIDVFNQSSNDFKNGVSLVEKSKSLSGFSGNIEPFISSLSSISDLLTNSPEAALSLLGFNGEKKYLVIIFNPDNQEPGGGTVKELKLIYVKNGKIENSKEIDSKDFGKYLGPPIEIPFFANRFGEIKTPSIESSIYKIGFSKNVEDIIDIYSSGNSQTLDGVIGIETDYYKSLTGGKFFDSMKLFGSGVKSKQIQIALTDQELQKVINSHNWSGEIIDNRAENKGVFNDFLGIIESNVDKKSNNLQISKTLSKKISVNSNGALDSFLTIAIKNSGGNPYKAYIQFLLPNKSTLTNIRFDGITQKIVTAVTDEKTYSSKNFKAPKGLEVDTYSESGKQDVGFLVEVPATGLKTITLSYELPYLVTDSLASFNYSLNLYKQPGAQNYNVSLEFNLPAKFQITSSPKSFDLSLDQDKNVSVVVSQK